MKNEISKIRNSAGITQAQLAKIAGISQAHISRIESGETVPSVEVLKAIAAALNHKLIIKMESK